MMTVFIRTIRNRYRDRRGLAASSHRLWRRAAIAACLTALSSTLLLPEHAGCETSSDALALLERSIEAMERQDSLLAGYRYLKTVVTEQLDRNMEVKKREEQLLEVTSVPHAPDVEVLVAVNGKPLSEKERKKREMEQRKGRSGSVRASLSPEDLVSQFDWSFEGTDQVNGRPTTVLRFRPKPGAVYKGKDPTAEKFLKKVSGRVWVDDAEFAITKVEFESTGSVKAIGGLFWTVRSLSVKEVRTRLDEGVWIDSSGQYFVDATALLVKSVIRRSTSRSHDYERPNGLPSQ